MAITEEEAAVLKEFIRAGEYYKVGDSAKSEEALLAMKSLADTNKIFWPQLSTRVGSETSYTVAAETLRQQVISEMDVEPEPEPEP